MGVPFSVECFAWRRYRQSIRNVPDFLDPVVVAEIDDRLDRAGRENDVVIPWAI